LANPLVKPLDIVPANVSVLAAKLSAIKATVQPDQRQTIKYLPSVPTDLGSVSSSQFQFPRATLTVEIATMFDSKIRVPKYDSDAFDNVEYELQMTYTLETDRRIMSFYDAMWGMEVSGGIDQFEPLTIVNVSPTGLAKRGGMRVGDEITQINDVPALEMTFNEALQMFRKNSRYVRVYVRG